MIEVHVKGSPNIEVTFESKIVKVEGVGIVDQALSLESENPVMNKILTARINGIETRIDSLPTKLSQFEDDVVAGKYLPLSGGTITSSAQSPLMINSSNVSLNAIVFGNKTGDALSYVGYSATYGTRLYDYGSSSWLGIKDGVPSFNNNTLLHSGNVGEYALKNYGNQGAIDFNNVLYNGIQYVSGSSLNGGKKYGALVSIFSGDAAWQIVGGRKTATLLYRDGNGTNDSWEDWKTIAFTDSDISGTASKAKNLVNSEGKSVVYISGTTFYIGDTIYPTTSTQILGNDVRLRYGENASTGLWLNNSGNITIGSTDKLGTSTATKLYVDGGIRFAPRTIWGQSFDGTVNVDGNITLGAASIRGYDNRNILESTANDLTIGYGYATSSLKTAILGGPIKLNNAMLINSSDNVTIGGSDLAGTSYKLHVAGIVRIGVDNSISTANWTGTLLIGADRHLAFDANDIQAKDRDGNPTALYINDWGGTVSFGGKGNGNVLIGTTTDDGYKLDVNGDARVSSLRSRSKDFIIYGYDGTNFLNVVNIDCNNSNLWIGYGSAPRSYQTNIAGNNIHLRYGTSRATGLILNSSGNVGIGTTNPAYKLDVNGDTHISGNLIVDGTITPSTASASYSLRGGTSNKTVVIIEVGSTEETIEHGLGADVAVSLYARDTTKEDSWVLTSNGDIEITDTAVIVTFDNPTIVEYKVVIVG